MPAFTVGSIVALVVVVVFILGLERLIAIKSLRNWLHPLSQNWGAVVSLVAIMCLSLGLNIIQLQESSVSDSVTNWTIFGVGFLVAVLILLDLFKCDSSFIRQTSLQVLALSFVIGISAQAWGEEKSWIGFLIMFLLLLAFVAYFLVVRGFRGNNKFRQFMKTIGSASLFTYVVLGIISVSLVFQYSSFNNNYKLGIFTIVLNLIFIGTIIFFFQFKSNARLKKLSSQTLSSTSSKPATDSK